MVDAIAGEHYWIWINARMSKFDMWLPGGWVVGLRVDKNGFGEPMAPGWHTTASSDIVRDAAVGMFDGPIPHPVASPGRVEQAALDAG